MRVRPHHLGVHERGLALAANPRDRFADRAVAGEEVGAVAAQHLQVGKRLDETRDVAAGRLHLDRHRDRVAVVFDEIQHGRAARARGVERFPELALARRAFADREIGDFVGVEPVLAIGNVLDPLVQQCGFGAADGVQTLRAGRTALRRNVDARVAPVRGHLPAAGARIVLRAHRREQHLERGHAERQAERAIAIVRDRTSRSPACRCMRRRREHALVAGAADLKVDQALVLELNLLVVDAPREEHRPIGVRELLAGEPLPRLIAR